MKIRTGSVKRARAEVLQVRVNLPEKQTFLAASELAGMPISAWVRERLRAASRRELIEAGLQVPFIQQSSQG
jgi:hypothetical protein